MYSVKYYNILYNTNWKYIKINYYIIPLNRYLNCDVFFEVECSSYFDIFNLKKFLLCLIYYYVLLIILKKSNLVIVLYNQKY